LGSIVVGVLVLQFLLVGGYPAGAERSNKRSELLSSGLAVLTLTMWMVVLTLLVLDRVAIYAADLNSYPLVVIAH
jgi:hypothetical protein